MVGRGDLQETTILIGEAPLVTIMFVMKLWMWICGPPNWSAIFAFGVSHTTFSTNPRRLN